MNSRTNAIYFKRGDFVQWTGGSILQVLGLEQGLVQTHVVCAHSAQMPAKITLRPEDDYPQIDRDQAAQHNQHIGWRGILEL